jgi:hypothetical protein
MTVQQPQLIAAAAAAAAAATGVRTQRTAPQRTGLGVCELDNTGGGGDE